MCKIIYSLYYLFLFIYKLLIVDQRISCVGKIIYLSIYLSLVSELEDKGTSQIERKHLLLIYLSIFSIRGQRDLPDRT